MAVNLLIIGGIFFGFSVFLTSGLLLWMWLTSGNIKADVFEERADGSVIILYSNIPVRFNTKPGKLDTWQLAGTKIAPFKPIEKNYLLPMLKKRKDKVYLFRDKDGFFHPMLLDLDPKTRKIVLKTNYRDQIDWIVGEHEEKAKIKEKQSAWQQYEHAAMLFVTLMVCFMMVFFGFQFAQKGLDKYSNAEKAADAKIAQLADIDPSTIIKAAAIVQQQDMLNQTSTWTQTTGTTNPGLQT